MLPIRTAHLAFLLLLMPVLMNGMNTSEKITAVPLCAPDKTVWHATFAGNGQEIRPTVVLSTNFLFNTQDMRYVNAHAHLQGTKKKEEDKDNSKRTPSHAAELVRMYQGGKYIDLDSNSKHYRTISHALIHTWGNNSVALRNLAKGETQAQVINIKDLDITRDHLLCFINVMPEKPIAIFSLDFSTNRKIDCWDPIINKSTQLYIPDTNNTVASWLTAITHSGGDNHTKKIAVATREHVYINNNKLEQTFVHLINMMRTEDEELKVELQKDFPIQLKAHEALAGLGWTTNGEKLVVLRKPTVQRKRRIASAPDLILETYSAISGKRITCANMPIFSSGNLEIHTELSNDHSLLITGNTLATTPRPFVLENTIHDMKKQLPAKDLPHASTHNIISLLRQRELNGSKIAYHQAAAKLAIEPVQQQ